MLIDELHEELKSLSPNIDTIRSYHDSSGLEQEYQRLKQTTEQEDFWQHPEQTKLMKDLQKLTELRREYQVIIQSYQELPELLGLFANEEEELHKLGQEIRNLRKKIDQYKIHILLNKPQDAASCFFSINAGAGGTESQDWANMLLRMYLRFCERENFSAEVIDYQAGEEAGIKSATLFIQGSNTYGLLKGEHGIHRLVRISPFDASKRRHTSFAGVHVIPEAPELEVEVQPQDLRIDTYRAGGSGGQHINTTDSAVRITHLPTNIVVQCQNERSQAQNKATAMKMLHAKLAQKTREEREAKLAGVEKKKIEWGSQIRSYVLHPYKMVKDHRTGVESPQPDLVLDGDIMQFIEGYLLKSAT